MAPSSKQPLKLYFRGTNFVLQLLYSTNQLYNKSGMSFKLASPEAPVQGIALRATTLFPAVKP